jgi:hypothetical protein
MLRFLKTINKICMNHESSMALDSKYFIWNIFDPDNIEGNTRGKNFSCYVVRSS